MGALPTITSPSIGFPPSCAYPRQCLTRRPRAGSASAAALGLLLFDSAVCSDRPQFGIHLICFLFLCPTAQLVLARPGFPPPIRPSYLQALGPQQLAWSNCLIAIPGGHTSTRPAHDLSRTNRKALVFPPSVFRPWRRDTQIPTPTCLSVASTALALVSSHICLLG